MAATKNLIFFKSTDLTGMSQLTKEIAKLKFTVTDATNTIKDIAGLNAGTLLSYINGLSAGTYHNVVIATAVDAVMTQDNIAQCDKLLVTANKGTVVNSGTCQANSTATEIILAADASGSNDTYNGKYIKTAGTTVVYRYITDYVGSTKTATVSTTTTAITTTETYIVYTNDHIFVVGDAVSAETAPMVAWTTFFPTFNAPSIVKLLGGTDGSTFAAFVETDITATSVATASSGVGTLTHTSHFTADAYINRWVGIESSTLGKFEIHQIADNTATLLTFNTPWRTTPTGTIKYQICDIKDWVLANKFLPYAIATYLQKDDVATSAIWLQLLDMYNTRGTGNVKNFYKCNEDVLKTYIQKGQAIADAIAYSVVS